MALYDSVGGVARKVTKKYDSVGGVARKLKKCYDSVNGVARQYFSADSPGKTYAGYTITSQSGDFGITIEAYNNNNSLDIWCELYHADAWFDDEGNETSYEQFYVHYIIVRDNDGFVINLVEDGAEWFSYVCSVGCNMDTSQLASTGKAIFNASCFNCNSGNVGAWGQDLVFDEHITVEIQFT